MRRVQTRATGTQALNTGGIGTTAIGVITCCLAALLGAALPTPARAASAQDTAVAGPALERDFANPPPAVRPWAYWWWVNGNVTEESIRRDLSEMKAKGIAGVLLFDSRGYHDDHTPPPPPKNEFMDVEWRKLLKFALQEAQRNGLEVSINLASGAGALKGPWPVGDDAPKKLVWSTTEVAGGRKFDAVLPPGAPGKVWDVAVTALRLGEQDKDAKPVPPVAASGTVLPDSVPAGGAKSKAPLPPLPVALEVVDLTDKVAADGRLQWDVPEGQWRILRLGYALLENHETDVDILDRGAVSRHFDRMGKGMLAEAGPLAGAGKTLTHFYSVSWEGAIPTWTPGFEGLFKKYRGYDLRPWMPALAGYAVKDAKVTERFNRDYLKTLGDCFADHCYGTLRDLCHAHGLKWHSESGGPWARTLPTFREADQLAFLGRNDMPQGEYWLPPRGFNRQPAFAAHIYGLPLAAAEAFTHMRPHWSMYPAVLKPQADAAFCDGINHLVWHTFTASPAEFGKPGIEYFAGTHFNPNVTWWEQSGPFLQYLARCQQMLRQGRHVADVCVYTGERPYLHWGRASEPWFKGAPLSLPKGYAYDLINTEVLLERARVENRKIVLPGGAQYRVLAVDLEDPAVSPEVLRKIADLAKAGAIVVLGKQRPTAAPGLRDYPGCDDEVAKLVAELWGEPARKGSASLGAGAVWAGSTLDEALAALKLTPDFDGAADCVHRSADGLDLYFVAVGAGAAAWSGSGGKAEPVRAAPGAPEPVRCTFRVTGRLPEIWDPVTGRRQDATSWAQTADGRIAVWLALPPGSSAFVILRKPAGTTTSLAGGVPGGLEVGAAEASGLAVRAWRAGRYALAREAGTAITLDAQKVPAPLALAGPWEVRFDKAWGGPESVTLEKLIPWTEHPLDGVKFYSGKATYRMSFDVPAERAAAPARLQLGAVRHVASVRVNGKELGVIWCEPWRVDLTGALKAGKNDLEIDVTNTWVNRLIGDAGLPAEKRVTKTNARRDPAYTGRHAQLKGYLATDPLDPSGLIGPVAVEFAQEVRVTW